VMSKTKKTKNNKNKKIITKKVTTEANNKN
jgi:hypothetical protein